VSEGVPPQFEQDCGGFLLAGICVSAPSVALRTGKIDFPLLLTYNSAMSAEIPDYRKKKQFEALIPEVVMCYLEDIANRHHTTVDDIVQRMLKVGFLLIAIEDGKDGKTVWRKTDSSEVDIRIFSDESPTPPAVDQENTSE
jgi:hypothetical protein